ncbi:hypothetical protein F5X99DRAFT_394404 [Biscogniauxia marginata]|nr:hypothetical protein F5X99DRAFT_394404 [Biscogniauxia marginata]
MDFLFLFSFSLPSPPLSFSYFCLSVGREKRNLKGYSPLHRVLCEARRVQSRPFFSPFISVFSEFEGFTFAQ